MCSTSETHYRAFSSKKKIIIIKIKSSLCQSCGPNLECLKQPSSWMRHRAHDDPATAAGADVKPRRRVQGCSCHLVSEKMYAEDWNESQSEAELALSYRKRGQLITWRSEFWGWNSEAECQSAVRPHGKSLPSQRHIKSSVTWRSKGSCCKIIPTIAKLLLAFYLLIVESCYT